MKSVLQRARAWLEGSVFAEKYGASHDNKFEKFYLSGPDMISAYGAGWAESRSGNVVEEIVNERDALELKLAGAQGEYDGLMIDCQSHIERIKALQVENRELKSELSKLRGDK